MIASALTKLLLVTFSKLLIFFIEHCITLYATLFYAASKNIYIKYIYCN